MTKISFKIVIYLATLLTGLTALSYQVVWQKYLSYIVGSESRSISLVIAVFLMGLAFGYRFWGKYTSDDRSKRSTLKMYGLIECAIGLYALLFPHYFGLIKYISFAAPDNFMIDIIITFFTLFLPTFLMGATIPLLTVVLPDKIDDVNTIHAKIYGINTLGAFLGSLLSTLLFIPQLGLSTTLNLCGALNIIIGLLLVFNPLSGKIIKEKMGKPIQHMFSNNFIYYFVFVTGTVSIGLEVICIRILNLTIGSHHYNFAIIVSIFILGLGLGSLSLNKSRIQINTIKKDLISLSILIAVIFFTFSYWPYWISTLRAGFISNNFNYYFFNLHLYVFLLIFLFPPLFFFGRLLPCGYGLLDKNEKDYGKACGLLYYYNTIGTFVGAVLLGHLLLYIVNIDIIFKICIILIISTLIYMLSKTKERMLQIAISLLFIATVIYIPNRDSHHIGLFRDRSNRADYHYSEFFKTIKFDNKIISFEDGPNTTVTVTEHNSEYRSIIVNGKSDGATGGKDKDTVILLAALPYLYIDQKLLNNKHMDVSVVGLGTGITAGAMGIQPNVKSVDVLEISPAVINSLKYFEKFNYDLLKNPKIQIHDIASLEWGI